MPATPEPRPAGQPVGHLGPHAVGQRVVVRRVLPGVIGPSGGPALTDVLGVMESWADGVTTVRREDGEVVSIRTAEIVSGKPVPPRRSRFSRLPPETVLRHAEGGFRRKESRRLGEWELRYVGGRNPRPNAALAIGDPGQPLDDALEQVRTFAAAHDVPARVQVVVGSELDAALTARGWTPGGEPTDVLVAGVAALARTVAGIDTSAVRHQDVLTPDWLVGNDRALANYAVVSATLDLPDAVFASIEAGGRQLGRVRTNLVDDWAFVADLMVSPEDRRQGLARVLMADAIDWAAERGATAMVLGADADNQPAQRLYADLGFERHHAFRLLQAP